MDQGYARNPVPGFPRSRGKCPKDKGGPLSFRAKRAISSRVSVCRQRFFTPVRSVQNDMFRLTRFLQGYRRAGMDSGISRNDEGLAMTC